MKRDTATVRKLIDQHVDVNAPGTDGTPALHWLVRVDDFETARRLIRAGADVSKPNRYGVTPMSLASANGNAEMIALLLEAGADANVTDQTGETALMTATKVGNVDAVRMLLDHGATVDARDPAFQQTALMMAVRKNRLDVLKLLIDRGAQVNVQTRTGATPGWILPNSVPGFGHGIGIVRGGLPERGSRYLIPGAMTPLLYAARDGRLESAKLLLSGGAEIEHSDANGITPLLMAITNNHIELARFLIGLYIGKQGLESTYGAAASMVVVLIWVYYSSQIVLFGAELCRAFAQMRSDRTGASPRSRSAPSHW